MQAFAAFAAHEFELSAPQDDGATLREHLMAYQRQTGRQHPSVTDAPALPVGCSALWRDFMALHSSRPVGMAPGRITFGEIDAFQRVTGVCLAAWEVDAIRAADAAYIANYAERKAGK